MSHFYHLKISVNGGSLPVSSRWEVEKGANPIIMNLSGSKAFIRSDHRTYWPLGIQHSPRGVLLIFSVTIRIKQHSTHLLLSSSGSRTQLHMSGHHPSSRFALQLGEGDQERRSLIVTTWVERELGSLHAWLRRFAAGAYTLATTKQQDRGPQGDFLDTAGEVGHNYLFIIVSPSLFTF